MSRHTVTIDIEDGFVRAVAFRGSAVVAWGTAALGENGLISETENGSLDGKDSQQLKSLLQDLLTRRCRFVVSLPLYSSLIRHLDLPKIGRRYIGQVVLSEVLEAIPFSQEEVDLTWQRRKNGKGHQVIAVATPKGSIDSHLTMLKKAGCSPAAAYPRAMALSLAVGMSEVLVAEVGLQSATVVLVSGGAPQIIHKVDLPNGGAGAKEVAEAVVQVIERVSSYREVHNGAEDRVSMPVVVVGQLGREPQLMEAIGAMLKQEVLSFTPPFESPEHFPIHEYAANLGLAQGYRTRRSGCRTSSGGDVVSLNVLPERHRGRPLPITAMAVFGSLMLFGYASFGLSSNLDEMRASQAMLSSQVKTLERQERSHRLSLARSEATQRRIDSTLRIVSGLESHLGILQNDTDTLLTRLKTATEEALPAEVRLSSLMLQEGGFVLAGASLNYKDVIEYTRNLQASGVFKDVRLLRVELSGAGGSKDKSAEANFSGVSFQLKLYLLSSTPAGADESSARGSGTSPQGK